MDKLNDASSHNFFAQPDRTPKTGDRSGLNASVNHILFCFSLITGIKADIHKKQ